MGFAPMERDARTNSCSLMDRTCPRTCRAMPTQYNSPNTMKIVTMPAPILTISSLLEPLTTSLMATDKKDHDQHVRQSVDDIDDAHHHHIHFAAEVSRYRAVDECR